jgi:hypothetical protein
LYQAATGVLHEMATLTDGCWLADDCAGTDDGGVKQIARKLPAELTPLGSDLGPEAGHHEDAERLARQAASVGYTHPLLNLARSREKTGTGKVPNGWTGRDSTAASPARHGP